MSGRPLGVDLQVLDPDARGRAQFDGAHNSIPIALGVIGDAVRITADIDNQAVIDAHGQRVRAGVNAPRSYSCGVERLRFVPRHRPSSQTRVSQCGRSRERTTRLPAPVFGDLNVTLEPGWPRVVLLRLQPEWHLDIAGLSKARDIRAR